MGVKLDLYRPMAGLAAVDLWCKTHSALSIMLGTETRPCLMLIFPTLFKVVVSGSLVDSKSRILNQAIIDEPVGVFSVGKTHAKWHCYLSVSKCPNGGKSRSPWSKPSLAADSPTRTN